MYFIKQLSNLCHLADDLEIEAENDECSEESEHESTEGILFEYVNKVYSTYSFF